MVNIAKRIIEVYDWISGPPLTEKERVARAVAEYNKIRMLEFLDV